MTSAGAGIPAISPRRVARRPDSPGPRGRSGSRGPRHPGRAPPGERDPHARRHAPVGVLGLIGGDGQQHRAARRRQAPRASSRSRHGTQRIGGRPAAATSGPTAPPGPPGRGRRARPGPAPCPRSRRRPTSSRREPVEEPARTSVRPGSIVPERDGDPRAAGGPRVHPRRDRPCHVVERHGPDRHRGRRRRVVRVVQGRRPRPQVAVAVPSVERRIGRQTRATPGAR